jgi:hypothetical protein
VPDGLWDHVAEARGSFGTLDSRNEISDRSEIFRSQTSSLGDSGQHLRADFLIVVERKHDVSPIRPASVRCEPHCRFSCQPIFNRAASTRRAFVDGQLLKRPET